MMHFLILTHRKIKTDDSKFKVIYRKSNFFIQYTKA